MLIHHPSTGATLECEPRPDAKGDVLILPGGGYRFISPREGAPVARAFADAGWRPFVLTYTVEGETLGDLPLREAFWAVDAIRRGAGGGGGGPLAVCGFSAGGHLAGSLGVHWDDAARFPGADDRRRLRPDAMVLCYPVVTDGPGRHPGSFERLTGGGDTAYHSLEKHVNAETPPAFLWHTAADGTVPVRNSLLFAEALSSNGVPFELHVYPFGVHGLSLATPEVDQPEEGRVADAHVAGWFDLCIEWLDEILEKKK